MCEEKEWKNPFDINGTINWAPGNLQIEQISVNEVKLTWEQQETHISGFKIDKKVSGEYWQIEFGSVGKNSTEWIDSTAVDGSLISYRLYAYAGGNKSNSINSSIVPKFSCPSNFDIIPISASQVKLTWDVHPFSDVLGYKIERKTNNENFEEIHSTTGTEYTDSSVLTENTYAYGARAYTEKTNSNLDDIKKIEWFEFGYPLLWEGNHDDIVNSVSISPDNSKVVSGSDGDDYTYTVKVWDAKNGNLLWTGDHDYDDVYSVNFSPDNSKVVSGGSHNAVRVWDAENGDLLWISDYNGSEYCSVSFSSDNLKIISWRFSEIRIWDADDGTLLWRRDHGGRVKSVSISPDNSKVVSGGDSESIKIWNAVDGLFLWRGLVEGDVYSVNFSPDNTKVVSGGLDYAVMVWDVEDETLLWKSNHGDVVLSVNFSPDNSKVVSGGEDNTLKVWDANDGNLLWIGYHEGDVHSVSFSSDNSKVVSGSYDNTFKVWDSDDGTLLWKGYHDGLVTSVSFSSDNLKVVSGSDDYTTRVWKQRPSWLVSSGN